MRMNLGALGRFLFMNAFQKGDMKKIFLLLLVLWLATGCAASPVQASSAEKYIESDIETLPSPTPLPSPTHIPPTEKPAPALPTPTQVQTPTLVPTPAWVRKGPGEVTCPILLYHRIAILDKPSAYAVSPTEFRGQMQKLKEWGYTSITPSQLVDAIRNGAPLPQRPVVISFDDGDITVFSDAYPIMQEFGFVGVNYLVANYVNAEGYMTVDQLKILSAAGWETGSHTMSHRDLTTAKNADWQLEQSRVDLEAMLGVPVTTMAYPYGISNEDIRLLASNYYRAGMGLGVSLVQGQRNLYYLWRRPVKPGWDAREFGSYLLWAGPLKP